jgi:squalene-hopene/tetraprenyl-beta-curcumene cyclase
MKCEPRTPAGDGSVSGRPAEHDRRRRLEISRRRLVERLVGRIGADGAVRDRCGSRVLESALMLLLLAKTGLHHTVRTDLTRYLRSSTPSTALDSAVAAAALGRDSARSRKLAAEYLAGFDHYTGVRKRLLLTTLLAMFGLATHAGKPDPDQIDYGDYATWTNLTLCAVKVLRGYERGRPDLVSRADRAYLLRQLRDNTGREVWEGNVLAHLIALHAVWEIDPGSDLVREHVTRLVHLLNPDGGMPFIEDQDIYLTATAGVALARTGLTGHIPVRMSDFIASHQSLHGGWGYATNIRQTDVDDTAWCIDFLRSAAPGRHLKAITSGERYLETMAGSAGGFATYLRHHPPEPAMTAGVVVALAPAADRYSSLLRTCVEFLLDSQLNDGTWRPSWTISATSVIMRVLDALHAYPSPPAHCQAINAATRRSIGYLDATQNLDGGWGRHPNESSDVLSTVQALSVIKDHGRRTAAHRGVRYLMSHQQDDGGFSSIPDQVGPRPFPYDFPILTEIFSLFTLNRLLRS